MHFFNIIRAALSIVSE